MKNLESLIKAHSNAEPRRNVSHGFSDRVMAEVHASKGNSFLARIASARKGLAMYKITKPTALIGGLGIVLLTTATGFATLKWTQPDVALDSAQGITTLSNGDRRFWIDYTNCPSAMAPTGSKAYYEIKAGSKLTPEQLTQGLLASCDSNELSNFFPQIAGKKGETPPFKPYQDQYYTPIVTFRSASSDTITVDNGSYKNVNLPVDQDAAFYSQGKQVQLRDLRPGDTIDLVVHTTALAQAYSTETIPPDQLASMSKDGFPIGATVQGGVRYTADHWQIIDTIMQKQGTDWTTLKQDASAPDGWSQVTPLANN